MSNVLAFWRYAYELTEEEFATLDEEGLAIMAAALTEEEAQELRRWLAKQERQGGYCSTLEADRRSQEISHSQMAWWRKSH